MKIFFTLSLILLVNITAKSQTLQANMPFVDGKVNSIVRYENIVYIGGEFDSVGGIYKPKLAAFDAITGAVLSWDPQPNGIVYRLVLVGNKLVVGGSFTNISGVAINRLANYDLPAMNLLNYNLTANETVRALHWDGNDFIYYVKYVPFGYRIVRYNINSGIEDMNWSSDEIGFGIFSVSTLGNYIYAAGDFSNVNNSFSIKRLARFDLDTGAVDTSFYFNWGTSGGWLEEVLGYNNKIYITGSFNELDGLTRKGIAEIDPVSGSVTSLNIYCSNQQNYALFPQGNTLWIGGSSAIIGGTYAYRIKQVDINTGLATCWNTLEMSPYGYVKSIWVTNDTVYAGGPMLNSNQTYLKVFNGNDSWTTLGPDTLICPGNSYTISADPTFVSYLWNTGAITSSITVNAPGNYWVTGTHANNCKATDTINVEFCTSINYQTTDNIFNLNLFPNPVENEFTVSFYTEKNNGLKIELYNSLGQSVVERYHDNLVIGLNEITLTTKDLLPGIYYLKITNDSMDLTRKIIKL